MRYSINVNIPSGSLVAVVGQVGSGKSTLLSALLGETEKLDGNVYVDVRNKITYVFECYECQFDEMTCFIVLHTVLLYLLPPSGVLHAETRTATRNELFSLLTCVSLVHQR